MPMTKWLNLSDPHAEESPRDYLSLDGKFPYRPTLFLGVGGTGSHAVGKVKSLFRTYISPQRHEGQSANVPDIDPRYAFLAFDTNQGDRVPDLNPNSEWFHLGVENMEEFYRAQGHSEFFSPWVVKGYRGRILAGANGYRNLGRIALMANFATVQGRLQEAIGQIKEAAARPDTINGEPAIHLFCSLSGGTGSGMFLDTCFLLRYLLPQSQIIGHIAVLQGLQNSLVDRRKVMINTYAALKELDAFMTGLEPEREIEYPFTVRGVARAPFDRCFLISSSRNDNSVNLPTHDHVTSYLARVAFAISAYTYTERKLQSPDFEGIMVNSDGRLQEPPTLGAHPCYLVPGFAQAHFPVREVHDLFVLESAKRYLKMQIAGKARAGEEEAAAFVTRKQISRGSLLERMAHNPGGRGNLLAKDYTGDLDALMKSDASAEQREDLLNLGRNMPAKRLETVLQALSPNLNSTLEDIWSAVQEEMSRLMIDVDHMGLGAVDFLKGLSNILQRELAAAVVDQDKDLGPRKREIERDWRTLEITVTDVMTHDSLLDRIQDALHFKDAYEATREFLNRAEQVVLESARYELLKTLLTRLISSNNLLVSQLEQAIKSDIPEAIKALDQQLLALNTVLYSETHGEDMSVENIRSINVIDQQWRDFYMKKRGLNEQAILNNLLKTEVDGTPWHPRRLLDLHGAPGEPLSLLIAQQIIGLIEPLFSEVLQWRPADVLMKSDEFGHAYAIDLIAKVYEQQLQPQAQISSMKNRLLKEVDTLLFCGGIDRSLWEELRSSDRFQRVTFNFSDNQERDRINFLTANLPIALAGCNMLVSPLEDAYRSFRAELLNIRKKEDREYAQALHHCFPNSEDWPMPTQLQKPPEKSLQSVAGALAISLILGVTPEDEKLMNAAAATPREKGYGLFQMGASQFWLWPYFEPCRTGSVILSGPIRLGSNLKEAYEKVVHDEKLLAAAGQWTTWFENEWSSYFKAGELQSKRQQAITALVERKAKIDDPDLIEFWDSMIRAISDWQIG